MCVEKQVPLFYQPNQENMALPNAEIPPSQLFLKIKDNALHDYKILHKSAR